MVDETSCPFAYVMGAGYVAGGGNEDASYAFAVKEDLEAGG